MPHFSTSSRWRTVRGLAAASLSVWLPLSLAGGARAGLPALEDLEARLAQSPLLASYDTAIELGEMTATLRERATGLSLYGSVGYTGGSEIVDENRVRDVARSGAEVGLRLPVLGSRSALSDARRESGLALARARYEKEQGRRALLARLRRAYADYWVAEQLSQLATAYLERESEVMPALRLRTDARLLLESDRLEFQSGFELARRDHASAAATLARAFSDIQSMVAVTTSGDTATRLPASSSCRAPADITLAFERHPDVESRQQLANARLAAAGEGAASRLSSDVRAGYRWDQEQRNHKNSNDALLAWSFEMPLNAAAERRVDQQSRAVLARQAEQDRAQQLAVLQRDYRALIDRRSELDSNQQFSRIRVAASEAAVQEREQRAVGLAGDTLEQLQQARYSRYTTAKALVEADAQRLYWYADFARFEPEACASANATGIADRGLYVWHSAALLASNEAGDGRSLLAQLAAAGYGRLLLSLDARQIASYTNNDADLRRLIAAARGHGMAVDLLLGDPGWLLPAGRAALLQTLRALSRLPFATLQLDIEPEQLENSTLTPGARLAALAETLRAVRAASAWPVGLSVHPRNLQVSLPGGQTFAQLLAGMDVEATLMIYAANVDRVVDIARAAVAGAPQLRWRVAVSSESTLGADESLQGLPEAERARRIAAIGGRLAGGNFGGVTLQPDPDSIWALKQ